MKTDWNHIELFGWYDHQGKAYLIPLQENRPMVKAVITGVREAEMPLLDIAVPKGAELHMVPENKNPYEYAKELGGFYAVGFYVDEGFERAKK